MKYSISWRFIRTFISPIFDKGGLFKVERAVWLYNLATRFGTPCSVHQVQENTLTNIYQIRRSSHKSIVMTSFIFTKSSPKILSKVKTSSVELMGNLRVLHDVYSFRKFAIFRTNGINSIKGQVILNFQKYVYNCEFSRENVQ